MSKKVNKFLAFSYFLILYLAVKQGEVMKYYVYHSVYIVLIFCSSLLSNAPETSPLLIPSIFSKRPSSERKENAKIVLANLAQMIGHIGSIVEEPHDTATVETAVTNIVSNIVKITMHAVHNKKTGMLHKIPHIMPKNYQLTL